MTTTRSVVAAAFSAGAAIAAAPNNAPPTTKWCGRSVYVVVRNALCCTGTASILLAAGGLYSFQNELPITPFIIGGGLGLIGLITCVGSCALGCLISRTNTEEKQKNAANRMAQQTVSITAATSQSTSNTNQNLVDIATTVTAVGQHLTDSLARTQDGVSTSTPVLDQLNQRAQNVIIGIAERRRQFLTPDSSTDDETSSVELAQLPNLEQPQSVSTEV